MVTTITGDQTMVEGLVNGTNAPVKVDPEQVGWQFAQQYYTFMNLEPHRLHCFYKKNSTMTHGTLSETTTVIEGQQEIHKHILALGYQDCKVVIQSVDSQPSLNESVLVMVIGRLSNKGSVAKKFAQTFFLAVQPNGYYVLNDVFRFVREESETKEVTERSQENSHTKLEESTQVPSVVHTLTTRPTVKKGEPTPVETTGVGARKSSSSDKKSTLNNGTSVPMEPAKATEPAGPKTWASLAALGREQWGHNVAAIKGTTVVVQETPPLNVTGKATKERPGKRQSVDTATPPTTAAPSKLDESSERTLYVHGIVKGMNVAGLRQIFQQFGAVRDINLLLHLNCAYIEFDQAENAKRAMEASPFNLNGVQIFGDERRSADVNTRSNRNGKNGSGSTGSSRTSSQRKDRSRSHEGSHSPSENGSSKSSSHNNLLKLSAEKKQEN